MPCEFVALIVFTVLLCFNMPQILFVPLLADSAIVVLTLRAAFELNNTKCTNYK